MVCDDEGRATQTAFRAGDRPAGLPEDAPSAGRLPDVRRRGRYRQAHANAPGRDRMRELLPLLHAGWRRRQNASGTRWRGRGARGGAALMVFSRNPCLGAYHGGGRGGLCELDSRNGTRARCARVSCSLSKTVHRPDTRARVSLWYIGLFLHLRTHARASIRFATTNWHFGSAHKRAKGLPCAVRAGARAIDAAPGLK